MIARIAGLATTPLAPDLDLGDGRRRRDWQRDVRAARAAFARLPRGPVVLYHAAVYDFSVWLYAAWHDGRRVRLPADRLATGTAAAAGALPIGQAEGAAPTAWSPADADAELPAIDPELAGVVVYTSGSSGAPSAIGKSLAQLQDEADALEATLAARLPDAAVFHATVSHQHMYGLAVRLFWPLLAGRPFVTPALEFPAQLAQLPRHAVVVTSPAFLQRLPDLPVALGLLLSSGGALPMAVAQDAARRAAATVEIYGSSETGALAWRPFAEPAWRPLEGAAFMLCDGAHDDGADDNALAWRAPWLSTADWQAGADRARRVSQDDHAQRDGFELLGRADRIVKIEDQRVALGQVEAALAALPGVGAARVALLQERRTLLGAVVVLAADGRADYARHGRQAWLAAARAILARQLVAVAIPRRWRLVDALPTDPQGKTSDARLRTLLEQPPFLPLLLEIRVTDDDKAELTLEVAAGLAVFDGHFPGRPILPGVALLHWALDYARRHLPLRGRFCGLKALKFHRVVTPDTRVHLDLHWQPGAAGRHTLRFLYRSALGRHAEGHVVLQEGGSA